MSCFNKVAGILSATEKKLFLDLDFFITVANIN